MKVMLLIPHAAGGGGEKILSELSQALGESCILVVFEESFGYTCMGKVVSLDLPIGTRSRIGRLLDVIRRGCRFRRVLRMERPDVVISFMGEANLLNALLSHAPVVTVHNHLSSTYQLRPWLERTLLRVLIGILYRRARVVAVSRAVRRDLIEVFRLPPGRVSVIPNSVDVKRIGELAAEPVNSSWTTREPVIVTAGRLVREKGQWHLIRAFAQVRRSVPCQLVLIGTGELAEYLKATCERLGVAEHTHFLDWQSNPFGFFARSTIFVQPSLTEGFGLALVEAMACGLPVIATDCPGGVREILAPDGREEFGMLVPPLDGRLYDSGQPCTSSEQALAEAMVTLLSDSKLRGDFAQAGVRRAAQFGCSAFLDGYRRLISEAVPDQT
jgi:glycosyltransferase involved in cell wall biosynthesis